MPNEDSFIVEVMPRSGDTSDPGYRRYGPMSNREAVRTDAGLNHNLNHERYYTAISAAGSDVRWRSEQGIAAEQAAQAELEKEG